MSVTRDNEPCSMDERVRLWDAQLDDLDYFELFGIAKDATERTELDAYHRFALAFHPDRQPNASAQLQQALTRIFQRGVEAHQVLSNEQLRARYKTALTRGEKRLIRDDNPTLNVDLDDALTTLHLRCRSAGAKLFAAQAARVWLNRDYLAVRRALMDALRFDGDANCDIDQCVRAISQVIERTSNT
jgi:hypothetical protein